MVSDMERHQLIHLSNPDINYVRLENCKYCKVARMRNYESHRRNNSIPTRINVVNYYNTDTILYYYENPIFQDVEVNTSVKRLNSSTELKINKMNDFCSICQDNIDKNVIIRKIECGHKFHHECIDKWLETNSFCPICRYEI